MTWRLRDSGPTRLAAILAVIVICSGLSVAYLRALTPQFGDRSVTLSTAVASATATYKLSFITQTSNTMGSIVFQFCSNNPLPNTSCTAPAGFNDSQANLASQAGATGYTISPSSTTNEIILTRLPAVAAAQTNTYELNGIINPGVDGSYYVRLLTYSSADASGSPTGYGGLAFAITTPVSIQAVVPPYLLFCAAVTIPNSDCESASGDYVNFGELGAAVTKTATTQLVAGTNAQDGYNIEVNGTTMTSGNDIIQGLNSDVSRRGVSQFGLNLRANSTPAVGSNPTGGSIAPAYNQVNFFRFNPGDLLASSPAPAAPETFTVSYIVNVASGQAPGVYASTLTYVCVGNF